VKTKGKIYPGGKKVPQEWKKNVLAWDLQAHPFPNLREKFPKLGVEILN